MSESRKSLCDTCLYAYSCVYSDKGISEENHSVCNAYAPLEVNNEATRGEEE